MQGKTEERKIPELVDWEVEPGKEWYLYNGDIVIARYDKLLNIEETDLMKFRIEKAHYKSRMQDIVHHLNYFLTFFDTEHSSFLSTLSVKYMVDTQKQMSQDSFINFVLDRIITPKFIQQCKDMSHYLYHVNVNTDPDGKYRNSPKITNEQAEQIVSISFALRFILPLCVHFANIGDAFLVKDRNGKLKRGNHIDCLDRLFSKIVKRFEENDTHIFVTLCKFIVHRAEKHAQNNKTIFSQKEMIRGDNVEMYIDNMIHDVMLVKSLYKLDYTRSCVSFFDGIVSSYGINYNKENYSSKPTEIDSPDTMRDSDDHPSHAEAIEMQVYKLDESNPMINDVNRLDVMKSMQDDFAVLGISQSNDEYKFYYDNLRFTTISDSLLHSFFSPRFKDPYAIYSLSRTDRVELQVYLKRFLEIRGMPLLAQISTAIVKGYYKDNPVKTNKLHDRMVTHPVYEQVLATKFRYMKEIDPKNDPNSVMLGLMVNSTYELVDYNPEVNGKSVDDIDVDQLMDEYSIFLTII